jgi:glycogen(starch) synthase
LNAVVQSEPVGSDRPVARRAGASASALAPEAAPKPINSLQLGLGWFPECPGGLDRFYYELVDALPAAGVNCCGWIVGSSAASNDTQGRVRAFAAASDSLPSRLLAARAAVRASIRDQQPDVVVSHFALYAFPALRSLKGLPLVIHFQGPWAEESRVEGAGRLSVLGKRVLERAVYRRADRLICLSPAFADILLRDYGISRDKIRVVPAAVDVARFDIPESRSEARQKLGWPAGRPIVLCVRRLVRRMGLENLVEAAALLRSQIPDALILLAGRGPMTKSLTDQIEAAGLQDHVKLLGFVPDADLPRAYRAADLTIVPSVSLEGFGLVAAESLAAGTPALVTPVGGLPEVVNGLGPQWILPGPSGQQIAVRLGDILKGGVPNLSSAECAAHVRACFSWPKIALRIRHVYQEALGLRPCTDE